MLIMYFDYAETQLCLYVFATTAHKGARASLYTRFLDHTKRCTTVGWTLLEG